MATSDAPNILGHHEAHSLGGPELVRVLTELGKETPQLSRFLGELKSIDPGTHMMPMEQPEPVVAGLAAFRKQVDSSSESRR